MKLITRTIISLYPARWRDRYAREFHALLEDVPADWRTNFDLFKGVIRMQLWLPSFGKLAAVLSLSGLLIGTAISFALTPIYTSESQLRFTDSSVPAMGNQNMANECAQIYGLVLSRISLARLIQQPSLDLYLQERRKKPLDDVVEQMRANTRGTINRIAAGTVTFSLRFTYPDRAKAQAVNQALIARIFQEHMQDAISGASGLDGRIASLERRIAALEGRNARQVFAGTPHQPMTLEVIDPPSPPLKADAPNRYKFALSGLAAGLFLALVIVIFRRSHPPLNPLPDTGA